MYDSETVTPSTPVFILSSGCLALPRDAFWTQPRKSLLGPLGPPLGRPWTVLGLSWARRGPTSKPLRSVEAAKSSAVPWVLVRFLHAPNSKRWAVLGSFWGVLKPLGPVSAACWAVLGASCAFLGRFLGLPGPS